MCTCNGEAVCHTHWHTCPQFVPERKTHSAKNHRTTQFVSNANCTCIHAHDRDAAALAAAADELIQYVRRVCLQHELYKQYNSEWQKYKV